MQYKGFILDEFQEQAIHSIEKHNSVVVSAPTGSGKTLIADYIIHKHRNTKIIYTAPIKALSNQKFKEFSKEYGDKNVGLLTGDVVKNPDALILIMTTEIYRNMVLIHDSFVNDVTYVIFDEIHFLNDIERGYVWEESIIFSDDKVRFLCLSATIPNAQQLADWIKTIKNHDVDVIIHDKRPVPLKRMFYDAELEVCTLKEIHDIHNIPDYNYVIGRSHHRRPRVAAPNHRNLIMLIQDKLPCFFFCFSRQKCQDNALDLAKIKPFPLNPEITSYIRKKLADSPVEINDLKSTKILRQTLPYGIGFHHAGLLPIMKEIVEELFGNGLLKVLYTTETFAVGINMPAKTVCFEQLRKYDGINFRNLTSKEYFQIAGRAGRRGIDHTGYSYAMIDRRDFDYSALLRMTEKDTEPIKSKFRLSINTVLNLIKQHTKEEIHQILCMNFASYQQFKNKNRSTVLLTFDKIKQRLNAMKYIENDKLTYKGEFSSRIYADEIILGEIFATDKYKKLNEYQYLLILACLAYEEREKDDFYHSYPDKSILSLRMELSGNPYTAREKRFRSLNKITALIHPCYHGKNIFEIMKNSTLLEGDLIRFFRQILDRISQIKNATTDSHLKSMLSNCSDVIVKCLKDIDVI
jgi:superfamily II RNA helicase